MPLPGLKAQSPQLQPPEAQEEAAVRAEQPLEPVEVQTVEPGRPYQDFVESKLRQYLQDKNIRSLVKPTQAEIRAAAIPVLGLAQRYRPGLKLNPALNRAHMAVNAMQLHTAKSDWIRHPFTLSEASPNYVEALVQLADDAGWLAREIPLPDHPPPKHPPIYYTLDPATNRPVPRANSLIRGDYVYQPDGSRIAESSHIHPWVNTDILPYPSLFYPQSFEGNNAYYTLELTPENIPEIFFHWLYKMDGFKLSMVHSLNGLFFSPYPPSILSTDPE